MKDFQTIEDVNKIIEPIFAEGRKITAGILSELPKSETISEEEKKGDSFVEKLGLQKPVEKPRSFVEAMQAGKYGKMKSPGGAHEPASSEEYRTKISSATKDTLFAAKRGGVDVKFLETEHTDFDNNRHKHLVVALADLKADNPDKKFALLCGTDHENPRINEVTFSDAISASSCRIVDDAILGPEFHRRGKICEVDGKQKDAEK